MGKPLYVPAKIPTGSDYIFKGIEKNDLKRIAVLAAVFLLLAIGIYMIFNVNEVVLVLGWMSSLALLFVVFQRSSGGLSMVQFIGIKLRFLREQQNYKYIYKESEPLG